ncbi:GlcG/HbpS family heme-binding protein [Zobellella maritima]|uniref:GlcG/HbpS family heme-binding protein n=1 Tax=Zobellella maritima TaxID=2059725 RepID=UPI001300499A|nr:heme-binding protein [Zobellella maritima]
MPVSSIIVSEACRQLAARSQQDGGQPLCFAVVDDSGALIYLYRMDGAPERLIRIATGKAYTAARMGVSTVLFRQRLLHEQLTLSDFLDEQFTSLPGGEPLFDDGGLVGAVGVSGRALEEDTLLCRQFAELILYGERMIHNGSWPAKTT